MKVLLINGSPNMNGCTYTALTEVEKTLNEAGVDTGTVFMDIRKMMFGKTKKDYRQCVHWVKTWHS